MTDKNNKNLNALLHKGEKASKLLEKYKRTSITENIKEHTNDPESFISFLLITSFGGGLGALLFIVLFLIELYLVVFINISFICIPFILFGAIIFQYLFSWKNWVNRLPYPLIGWNDLIRVHTIRNSSQWRNITVKVTVNDKMGIPYAKAALNIFSLRAYDKFYSTTHENRKEWTVSNSSLTVIAEGSANNAVFGQMIRLFRNDLRKIQNNLHCIDKVEIEFNSNEFTSDSIPSSNAP